MARGQLNEPSLFSGLGGFSYAMRDTLVPIAYREIDPFCHKVLVRNMSKGRLHQAPISEDVRKLTKGTISQSLDIVTGGFPCQDLSPLGHQRGINGPRSKLFSELMRVVRIFKPKLVFLENVPMIVSNGLDKVLAALDSAGYDSRWMVISAGDLGASHLRRRWYCLAKLRTCTDVVVRNETSPLPTWTPELSPEHRLVFKGFPGSARRALSRRAEAERPHHSFAKHIATFLSCCHRDACPYAIHSHAVQ